MCQSGQPYLWPAGGQNIPYHVDQGGLGSWTNAEAVALVAKAFQGWADIPTSTVSYVNAGVLPVDVDVTNFFEYALISVPDGLNPIVFDETGEIFDMLFGTGSGVWGFSTPERVDPSTCTILEARAFLKGSAFADAIEAEDVMVHEFGHFTNLNHTQLNMQLFFGIGATSSPDPNLFPPADPYTDIIETMSPGYFDSAAGMRTPHADEVSVLSAMYPEPDFFTSTGSICGTVYAPNGTTRLSGVNVVARNVLDPYVDAVSAISGNFALGTQQSDPFAGRYCLYGLAPGASYVVFVEPILVPGGYSPSPAALPGPGEFYNGPDESSNSTTDDPLDYDVVTPVAGSATTDIDIVFNQWVPGEPLTVGDEGAVELYLPFSFELCGEKYESVFVSANGYLTFGRWTPGFSYFPSAADLLGKAPRIAGFWADYNSGAGGLVTFETSPSSVRIIYENVPEWPNVGSNTFEIALLRSHRPNPFLVSYGDMTALNGIAGFSCGVEKTTGFEPEQDLTKSFYLKKEKTYFVDSARKTAVFEEFTSLDNDLAGRRLFYFKGTSDFSDMFEPNDTIRKARKVKLPFDTWSEKRFTEISPAGNDVDYFEIQMKAGDVLTAEILTSQLDTVMGLFQIVGHGHQETGVLLALDDDGGVGYLSRIVFTIPEDGRYAVAVSTYPDYDLDGDGAPQETLFGLAQGRYVLSLSK